MAIKLPNDGKSLKSLTDWLVESALPTWSGIGFDATAGRFRERLDDAGRPLDVPHRAMVQARQIYVFAHAAVLGWNAAGGALAETAMASLRRDFCDESATRASAAFSIGADGRVVSDVRDAYAHAFLLFAIAWLHRLNGDRELLLLAEKLAAFIDAELDDSLHGGVFDEADGDVGVKRQNPLMHLLEAYLALERSAPGCGWLERATALIDLFKRRLFDSRSGILREYFARDWSEHGDPAKGRMFEPGHHFEWVWLLREYEQLSAADMREWSDRLYTVARSHGLSTDGFVFDEIGADMRVLKRSHRVWPHTEAIKAAAARHAAGDPDAHAFALAMAARLHERFLDRPFPGGWVDHVDAGGAPLVGYVPASSLYHLFFAAAEASAGFQQESARGTARSPLRSRAARSGLAASA